MNTLTTSQRRRFLKYAAALGTARAANPLSLQLGAIAAAAAGSAIAAGDDYKALVCVYLGGGCDHLTLLSPHDPASYNQVAGYRGANLMAARDTLLPLDGATQAGRSVALCPSLPRLQALYNTSRKLAVVSGVGSMVEPITKVEIRNGSKAYPPGAGSHNDGNSMFHTLGTEGTQYGWGGRALDMLASLNAGSPFTSISVSNYNAFGSGLLNQQTQTDEYATATNLRFIGENSMFGSGTAPAELRALLRQRSDNVLEDAVLGTTQRVLDGSNQLAAAFAASNVPDVFVRDGTDIGRLYGDNSLGKQLRTVAKAIQQRARLGSPKRQVFFCSMGGYDTHGGTPDGQLLYVDRALAWFHGEMERQSTGSAVTLFTTSEFGRTLKGNGDGTDHGWGGNMLVLGGAVAGGAVYGDLVNPDAKGPDWVGHAGRDDDNVFQIPKISTEQYGATLARWFGLSDTDLATVFPRLGRFAPERLGFL